MLIHIVAGYINLALEEDDFRYRKWREFLENMKQLIPPTEREYDPNQKIWHIKATGENQRHIRALKQLYFPEDPN